MSIEEIASVLEKHGFCFEERVNANYVFHHKDDKGTLIIKHYYEGKRDVYEVISVASSEVMNDLEKLNGGARK